MALPDFVACCLLLPVPGQGDLSRSPDIAHAKVHAACHSDGRQNWIQSAHLAMRPLDGPDFSDRFLQCFR